MESAGYGRGSSSFRVLRTAGDDPTDSSDAYSLPGMDNTEYKGSK